MTDPTAAGAYRLWADTADRIRDAPGKIAKTVIIAEYFQTLGDADLMLAARYLAGTLFPATDQRTINIGGAAALRACGEITGLPPETWAQELVRTGDLGDAAEALWPVRANNRPALLLADVENALAEIAALSGTARKAARVESLLAQASTGLEAKYLIKLLVGGLRIGLMEGALEDAIARWAGVTAPQVQWANMLLGDIGETALRARRGTLAEAAMRLFHPMRFMLATPAGTVEQIMGQMGEQIIVEDKYDGIRAQAHVAPDPGGDALHGAVVDGVRVALFSRTMDDVTSSFPDLVRPLAALIAGTTDGRAYIFDGEVLPADGDRILPFQHLQKRLGRKVISEELAREVPLVYVAFDLLFEGSDVLISSALRDRRARLRNLPMPTPRVRLAQSEIISDASLLDDLFAAARKRGNEGLMVKDPASIYKPGRRGREWLKIKRAMAALDVVVTAVEVGNGRRSSVLSDYTFAVRASKTDGTLLNVGKAYSGLPDEEIRTLTAWFREHTVQEFGHGKVRIVEPRIVLEVTFDRVQPSARHKSGYALRFPRILRIRDDKPVEEIDTLADVARLAAESAGESPTGDLA